MKIVCIMAAKLNNKSIKEVYFCCSLFNVTKKCNLQMQLTCQSSVANCLYGCFSFSSTALWADKLNSRCHLPLTLTVTHTA